MRIMRGQAGVNEAPRRKLLNVKVELRRIDSTELAVGQPVFVLSSFDAVRPAIHPCSTNYRVFWQRRIKNPGLKAPGF